MRGPWLWIVAIAAGLVAVIGVVALVGRDDHEDQTVSAAAWAHSVCGSVAVWRGEIESIVDAIRNPSAGGSLGVEEPQSETPQGRTGFVRKGLERGVQATETMVTGIENAGIPDTPQGEEAAQLVADWGDDARDDLEEAQDALDEEADSLEDAVEQVTEAAGAIVSVLAGGTRTVADVARLDPELAAALESSSTCQELRQKEQSS